MASESASASTPSNAATAILNNPFSAATSPDVVLKEVGGYKFEIPSYYEPLKVIGKGAYGVVISAKDTRTGETIAIKKVNDVFKHSIEVQKRILREVMILKHFNHRNIIGLKQLVIPRSVAEFRDVYIVSELMNMDLRKVIHGGAVLTERHIKYILYQLLLALEAIHTGNVIHRDLKPSNVLVNIQDCHIKLCDFGLSRSIGPLPTHMSDEHFAESFVAPSPNSDAASFFHSTTYVVSRWYRAPELILCWPVATKALDIWSVGCIFAELLSRRILFQGNTGLHQLDLILNVTGTPAEPEMRGTDEALTYLKRLPYRPATPLRNIIGAAASPEALDLMEKMLRFDPMQRISVEDALSHPYLNRATLPKQALQLLPQPQSPFEFSLPHNIDPSEINFKGLIYDEIIKSHKVAAARAAAAAAAAASAASAAAASAESADVQMSS